MNSLIANINQAASDFNNIKQAIIDKGVEVPQGTPTSQYSELINNISGNYKKNISETMGYVSNGLVCHYSADSEHFSGGWRIHDLSGSDNSGVFMNYHTSIYLNGAENSVYLNHYSILMPEINCETITMDLVCKVVSGTSKMIASDDNTNSGCNIYTNGKYFTTLYFINGVRQECPPPFENDFDTHLFTSTYDGNTMKCYIDGVLLAEKEFSGDISKSSTVFSINGTFINGVNQNSDRGIINFNAARVYNRALSADEINTNYNVDKSIFDF